MTDKGRLAVERHLQKSFKSIKSSLASLQTVLAESALAVSSLANLVEQLESVQMVEFSTIPFAEQFPDLREKLLTKLEQDIGDKAERLTDLINPLQEKEEEVCKSCETTQNLLQKYSVTTDALRAWEATTTTPDVADMVQWLDNIRALLFDQYHCKLHLLETLGSEEAVASKHFVRMWEEGDDTLIDTVKVYLACVQQFLEEKR